MVLFNTVLGLFKVSAEDDFDTQVAEEKPNTKFQRSASQK